ncbi:putative oxidoreductase YurR [Sporosarcina sp. NCCP-2716]|uniref:NAD(P)/FAD-dependent oxidoreductase n=1 Tax=Sporosarcina sp. NCCP-2716 TaxID=2943679 RepID=UPI00203D6CEF|nr:FAD-dependent oxidoreductase [Sporosarcina sp. NCCP-2716]GKV67895.1 putative oxidoreductase YurR [Sporosarcina sp. NCCP-2716]
MQKIVIAGAGIAGCSAAYELAKRGCTVTVIDRADTGRATDAAAGIICPWLSQRRNQDWYRLVRLGARHYGGLIAELEQLGEKETGYRKVGALQLYSDEAKRDKAYERALARREEAPEIGDIEKVDTYQIAKLYPPAAAGYAGLHVSGAARVDGRKLLQALRRAAEHHGAEFIAGNAQLENDGSGTLRIQVDGRLYTADRLIWATGAWPPDFESLGLELAVRGQKAQIVHLDPHEEQAKDWPVVIPPGDQYLLSFDDGRVAAGATHEDDDVFNPSVSAGGIREVLDKALDVAPGLRHAEWVGARTGVRPFTPGFLPVAGEVPEHPGMYIINGLGASGLTAGPFIGKLLAQICTGEETDADMAPYAPDSAIHAH